MANCNIGDIARKWGLAQVIIESGIAFIRLHHVRLPGASPCVEEYAGRTDFRRTLRLEVFEGKWLPLWDCVPRRTVISPLGEAGLNEGGLY